MLKKAGLVSVNTPRRPRSSQRGHGGEKGGTEMNTLLTVEEMKSIIMGAVDEGGGWFTQVVFDAIRSAQDAKTKREIAREIRCIVDVDDGRAYRLVAIEQFLKSMLQEVPR